MRSSTEYVFDRRVAQFYEAPLCEYSSILHSVGNRLRLSTGHPIGESTHRTSPPTSSSLIHAPVFAHLGTPGLPQSLNLMSAANINLDPVSTAFERSSGRTTLGGPGAPLARSMVDGPVRSGRATQRAGRTALARPLSPLPRLIFDPP